MVGEPAPTDEKNLENAEWLDEQLRSNLSPSTQSADVPKHIEAGIRFLRSAFCSPREGSGENELSATNGVSSKPDSIGRFQLFECLGQGSFGVVYRAFDTVLKRDVALKLPRLLTALSEDLSERFLRESEAAARLHHPHIVQVYEAGFAEFTSYLAAEYCPGMTLEVWRKEFPEPVNPEAAARVMLRLADAVHHAHAAGILHRDLKPGNILISPPNGQEVSEDPSVLESAKITDFGLARFLNEGTMASSGGLAGTIAYMAPEQTGLRPGPLGPACDVFALGVILYELLTGKRPHEGKNPMEVMRRICEADPVPPRRLVPSISRDLESICLHCLEKDPARRYSSARAFREDLHRYLEGQITKARPLSIIERTVRSARQHPAWAGALGLVVTALVVSALAVSYHFRELGKSSEAIDKQRRLVQQREHEVADLLYVADLRVGLIALGQGDQATFDRQMAKYEDRPDVRGIEWEFLKNVVPVPDREIRAHKGPIYSSAVSPDEKVLATVGQDRVVRLWNIDNFELVAELKGHKGEINDLAFHPEGQLLATSSDDNTVWIWDLEAKEVLRILPHVGPVFGVAYSPDGKTLVTGGRAKVLRIWTEEGEPQSEIAAFPAVIDQLVFAADGVLGVASGKKAMLWDLVDQKPILSLPLRSGISRLAFSPDGKTVAAGSVDQEVVIWDRKTAKPLAVCRGHRSWIHDIHFTSDGESLVSCGKDGAVWTWPLDYVLSGKGSSGEDQDSPPQGAHVFQADPERAWSISLIPERRLMVTTGHGGTIRVWSQKRIQAPRFGQFDHNVYNALFSPSGKTAVVTWKESASLWDVESQTVIREFPAYPVPNRSQTALSKDGRWIAVALTDHRIAVDSVDGSARRRFLQGHERQVTSLRFSRDSDPMLFSAATDGTIRLWDVEGGEQLEIHRFTGIVNQPIELGLSADGKYLAAGNGERIVVWELCFWNPIAEWETTRGGTNCLEFTADNRQLASGFSDHTIELRELPSGDLAGVFAGHRDIVIEIVFSLDGRTLFSTSADDTLRAWHVPSQQEIGILFRESVNSLDLSGDGQKLLVGLAGRAAGTKRSRLLLWQTSVDGKN